MTPWRRRLLWLSLGCAAVYGMICLDVVLRARQASHQRCHDVGVEVAFAEWEQPSRAAPDEVRRILEVLSRPARFSDMPRRIRLCELALSLIDRSTQPELKIDICNACHPFYTGKLKYVDTAGRIEKFQKKFAASGYASLTRGKKKAAEAVPEAAQ